MSIAYVDTSALVKLVVEEAETSALRAWLVADGSPTTIVTSTLAVVELRRAARRHGEVATQLAERVLDAVHHVSMVPEILASAASLQPAALRTLDAIHLATALQIGSSLAAFIAYDTRLADAAIAAGLPVARPA
ncbi:MAG: PilT protein domain protein [Jatrophihabitantaceae bacterium]|nr:PilT protein domain protein [Jatrophihabitantaceae bacterium]